MILLISSIKKIIIIKNFNFDEKSSIHFNKFNEKDHIASILKKLRPN